MNEGLTGVEQHEGIFIVGWTIPLSIFIDTFQQWKMNKGIYNQHFSCLVHHLKKKNY